MYQEEKACKKIRKNGWVLFRKKMDAVLLQVEEGKNRKNGNFIVRCLWLFARPICKDYKIPT